MNLKKINISAIFYFCVCLLYSTETYTQQLAIDTATQKSVLVLNGQPQWPSAYSLDTATGYFIYKGNQYDNINSITGKNELLRKNKTGPIVCLQNEKVWFHFVIKNISKTDTASLIYFCGSHVNFELNCFENEKLIIQEKRGWMGQPHIIAEYNKDYWGAPVIIPPNSERSYWMQLYTFTGKCDYNVRLYTSAQYARYYFEDKGESKWIIFFFQVSTGVCLFLSITALIQLITSRDKTYLWWFLYLLFCAMLMLRPLEIYSNTKMISVLLPNFNVWGLYPIVYGAQFFYSRFIAQFLSVKILSPGISAGLRWYNYYLLSSLIFLSYAYITKDDKTAPPLYFIYCNVVSLLFYTSISALIYKRRNQISSATWMLAGSMTVWVTVIIYILMSNLNSGFYTSLFYIPNFYLNSGILIEMVFFSIAISLRAKYYLEEKNKLQQNYTLQLEEELSIRTNKIQQQQQQIDKVQQDKIQADFNSQLYQSELKALRSQINPHFIFNCLNSIKLYIIENNTAAAAEYLNKFSKLIRSSLDNSASEKISLSDELSSLQLYIELEAMRFKNKLQYEINVDENIDTDFVEVPPLLIQPYVENAIWHGIMHKEAGGRIDIKVTLMPDEPVLVITIKDNGIGREMSAALKNKSITKHKSLGTKVTAERLELLNQHHKNGGSIHIEDIKDNTGKISGTLVTIKIPFE